MATARQIGGSKFSHSLGSEEVYDLVCQPCQLDGKLQEAVGLCTDCQEYLCQRCYDVHTLPTPMRNHELLDKKQMVSRHMPLKTTDRCTEKCHVHEDEVIKYYCIDHCQLGCSVCITLDHRSCDNVRYIPHAAIDLANNEEYKQGENQLELVVKRSKKVTEEFTKKTKSLEKTCSGALKLIQKFRKDLNEVLDNTEADLVNKCRRLKSGELEKIAQIAEKYKAAQRDLEVLETMKETYQSNKQNCNLYTEMMKAKNKLALAEQSLKEAEKEQSSIDIQIKFVPNKDTLYKLKKTVSLGKMSKSGISSDVIPEQATINTGPTKTSATVKRSEPKMTVRQPEESAATAVKKFEPTRKTVKRIETPTAVKESESRTIVRAEHVQNIDVKTRSDTFICNITGLAVLSDNILLVTDYDRFNNEHVKLVDIKKQLIINHLKLRSAPWDVAIVTSSQVALTLPDIKKVAMVNVAANVMTIDKTLAVNGKCMGVDYRDGKLAVTFVNPDKVQVITLEGEVLHTITRDNKGHALLSSPHYVVFGHDNTFLYVSNYWSDSVVHVKLDGTVVDRYTDRQLRRPKGLLTDRVGNVYVCGQGSGNIHQITPDCKKIIEPSTGTYGFSRPSSMCYNEAECRLYVGLKDTDVIKEYIVTLGSK